MYIRIFDLSTYLSALLLESMLLLIFFLGSMAVGYDHLQISSIREKGIKVGYTPDVLTQATAELTVALLLATSRRLFEAADQLKK